MKDFAIALGLMYMCVLSHERDYLIICIFKGKISLLGLCYEHRSRQSGCKFHVWLFIEENEFRIVKGLFYNMCSLTFLIEHASLKQLFKSVTNGIDSFCSNNEV